MPAGVAGKSRDDLALAVPVVISDSGPGPTRAWLLLDKPEGSAAVLSSATGASTQFTPDVEGSYRVQLTVNGGPSSDYIAHVVAGVQLALPSWVAGDGNKVRIPAWGEKLDFNVKSAPGVGANARGWAYEVGKFFRTLVDYAFGVLVQDKGVAVGAEPFRSLNLKGMEVTDEGGGVLGAEVFADGLLKDAGYPSGIADRDASTIEWNNATKTLTHKVKAPATEFDVYEADATVMRKYTFAADQSATIAVPAYGAWWFYYNAGVLSVAPTSPPNGFRDALVALVYLDASLDAIAVLDERHGISMPWSVHEYLHSSIGTRYESGLSLSRVATGNGGANGDAQITISGGTIWDEDVEVAIVRNAAPSDMFEQELGSGATPGKIPVYYRMGAAGMWVKVPATTFPLVHLGAGQRPTYNSFIMGVWGTTAISANNNYAVMWVCATNSIGQADPGGAGYLVEPVFAIMGQGDYASVGDAQDASFADLVLGGFFSNELKPLWKLIYRCNTGYGNDAKAYIYEYVDLRNTAPIPATGFIATSHNSLSGRAEPDAHPGSAISLDDTGFAGLLVGVTDVQTMAGIVDGIVGGIVSVPEANTVFVTKGGNDGTGTRGERTKPFLTIAAALAVAQDGDLVSIGPGTFTESSFTIPNVANLFIVGSGMGVTTVELSAGQIVRETGSALDQLLIANMTYDRSAGSNIYIMGSLAGGYGAGNIGVMFYNFQDVSSGGGLIKAATITDVTRLIFKNVRIGEDTGAYEFFRCTTIEMVNVVRHGTREGTNDMFYVQGQNIVSRTAWTVSGSKFYSCPLAVHASYYVDVVIDSACDFIDCTGAVVAESSNTTTLLVSGCFEDSTMSLTLDDESTLVAKLRGVRGLSSLSVTCPRSMIPDINITISNSSIGTLTTSYARGTNKNTPDIVACNSCFEVVSLTNTLPDSPNTEVFQFNNCVILDGTVDGISDPGVVMRGGFTDAADITRVNRGQFRIYTHDNVSSTLYS